MQGYFLVIEGIDGCGKSTQCDELGKWASFRGVDRIQPKDPGTTGVGELIREILLHRKDVNIHPRTQAALFAAARCEMAHTVIKPFLDGGCLVIGDRWTTSTVVYQHYGAKGAEIELFDPHGMAYMAPAHPLSPHQIEMMCETLVDGITPDLTIILDLPVKEALKRIPEERRDRFESKGEDFLERTRNGYLAVVGRPGYRVLDVSGKDSGEVAVNILRILGDEAKKRGPESCLWRIQDKLEIGE